MRPAIVLVFVLFAATGCAPAQHPSCQDQGFEPGTREHQVCQDAGGNPLATGDGSPLNHEERLD